MIGEWQSTTSYSGDSISLSLLYNKDNDTFASVQPTSITFYSGEHFTPIELFIFQIPNSMIMSHGTLKNGLWIQQDILGVLTNKGKILIFQVLFSKKKVNLTQTHEKAESAFTCFTNTGNYLIAGSQNGCVDFIELNTKVFRSYKTGTFPITSIIECAKKIIVTNTHKSIFSFSFDLDSLTKPGYKAETHRLKPQGEFIIGNSNPFYLAIKNENKLTVTNFEDIDIVINCDNIQYMTLSYNGLNLYVITETKIYVFDYQRLQFYNSPNTELCISAVATENLLVFATPNGLSTYPLCFFSKSPAIYTRQQIMTFIRANPDPYAYVTNIDYPTTQLEGLIQDISLSSDGNQIVAAGSRRIFIVSLLTGKLFCPDMERTFNRHVTWFGDYVAACNEKNEVHIYHPDIHNSFAPVRVFHLQSVPQILCADDETLIFSSSKKSLAVVSKSFDLKYIKLPKSALCAEPSTKFGVIFALLKNHTLISISLEDSSVTEIRQNVTNFAVDRSYDMLYVTATDKLLHASKLSNFTDLKDQFQVDTMISVVKGIPAIYQMNSTGKVTMSPIIKEALVGAPVGLVKRKSQLPGYKELVDYLARKSDDPVAFVKKAIVCDRLSESGVPASAPGVLAEEGMDVIMSLLEQYPKAWAKDIKPLLQESDIPAVEKIAQKLLYQYELGKCNVICKDVLGIELKDLMLKTPERDYNVKEIISKIKKHKKEMSQFSDAAEEGRWLALEASILLLQGKKEEAKEIFQKHKRLWKIVKSTIQ